MAHKRYLFTPGPTPVPPQVLAALAEPVLHHRAPDFREVYARVLGAAAGGAPDGERRAPLHLLGDGGVRVRDRQPLLARRAGAGRLGRLLRRALDLDGAHVRLRGRGAPLRVGRDADGRGSPGKLDSIDPVSLVFLVHSETSTGVVADVQTLAAVAKDAGALVVVDAVSSLGAVPLEMDEWGLDVVISGSQKALMAPPGLATAAVSAAAWEQVERSTLPSFYFDWQRTRKAQAAARRRRSRPPSR